MGTAYTLIVSEYKGVLSIYRKTPWIMTTTLWKENKLYT